MIEHWWSIGYAYSGLRVKVLVAAAPAGVAARRLRRTPSGRTVASSCADERLLLGSAALKVALDPQVRAEGGLASHLTSGAVEWGVGNCMGLISFCRALSSHHRRAYGGHGVTWARRPQGRTHGRKPSGYQQARRPLGRVLALVLCGVCPGLLQGGS